MTSGRSRRNYARLEQGSWRQSLLARLAVLLLFVTASISAAGNTENAGVARKLAEMAGESQSAGEILRAFLLFSEAARRAPEQPDYSKKRDAIEPIAALLISTKLDSADIAEDVAAAERSEKEELAAAATPAAVTPTPAPTNPPAAAATDDAANTADESVSAPKEPPTLPENLSFGLKFRQDAAMSIKGPMHLTENRTYAYIDASSDLWASADQKYRLQLNEELRAYYDSVYGLSSFYPASVRNSEEYQVRLRRLLLNFSAPGWTVHVGLQQVVWGQALGMFIADVVNPKDYTLFLTQDFDDIRIPLWSLDVQRKLGKNGTLELFWTPDIKQSVLPVAGSEFAFYTPSFVLPAQLAYFKPARTLANSTVGLRYSWLAKGWDSSVFYLKQLDDLPATSSALMLGQSPFVALTQRFPNLNHFAASTSKPLGDFVLRSEVMYTEGEKYQALTLGPAIEHDSVTGMVGFSYPLRDQYMLDVQYFQTSIFGGAANLLDPQLRSGVAMRVADVASLRRFKPSIQVVMSPNQHDFWITPKLTVRLVSSLFATVGMDWFGGALDTQFGQFRNASRIETSLFWKAKSY